jgi:HD-GYP domain-containing protein (c-di-GMP phosphodiesterase class II)
VGLVLDVADRLGLDARERRDAEFAALLHDIGKIKIPGEIISKPGKLTDEEWATMKTHTVEGERFLSQVGGILGNVGRIVRSCHEDWDGTGYPDGLVAEDIPLVGALSVRAMPSAP